MKPEFKKLPDSDKPIQVGTADIKGGRIVGRAYDKDGKRMDKDGKSVAGKTTQMLELRKDNKTNAITTVGKDSVVTVKSFNRKDGLGKDLEKAYTLNASDWRGLNRNQNQNAVVTEENNEVYWRKLTCVEAERLQTVPDNYTNHVSNSQRYKMLGNSFTVLVISHILRGIKDA
jgi:site-specific DNA-cytosine methylase